ncbi:MAG: hypothetical protein QOG00_2228 [Pyrinomonadaceae bacterium]|nr:hypothetical protein [Pyrinomonadaceae bacterium]
MIQKIKFLPSIVALLLCLTAAAFGQERAGAIEGTITDPAGNVVPGVTVTISSRGTTEGARRDATTGFNRTLTTDDSGFFRAQEVPPGFYTVTTSAISGFSGATNPSVEVVLGKTTPVNFSLQTGNVSETVTVTSDAIAIDPTDNKIQTNITSQVAELLPKGTNITSLFKVSAATRQEPLSGGFQIDGASGSENTFIIDGQEVTNFRTGLLNTNNNLPFQLVQEVQIKSSGFEAEFGGATGGVINIVTKGGSNDFHGEFGMQFRPSEFQAGPRQFLRNFQTFDTPGNVSTFVNRADYIRPQRDNGTDFFPTANLGGPIVRDRLWFFTSYTPQFINQNRTLNYVSSDPRNRTINDSGTYRFSRKIDYTQVRLDAAPSNTLRLTGTFTYNPIRDRGALPLFTETTASQQSANFGGSIGTLFGSEFLGQQGGRQNSNNVTGAAVWTPTSKLVLNFRGGRSFLNEKLGSYGLPRSLRYVCSGTAAATALAGCSNGLQNFATNFQVDYDVSTRKTFDADASYLANNFVGRHQFKGGYQFNGIANNTSQGYADVGQLTLIYGTQTIANQTGQAPAPGAIGVGVLQRFGTVGQASSASHSIYFQDSWQPVNRLSLNLGIRAEHETVPSFSASNPGITFGLGDKIAPRLGVAYDVTGDGRTKVFASYGWFYDRFKYELPRGSFGGDFFRRDYFDLFPGVAYNSFTVAQIIGNAADPANGAADPTCDSDNPAVRRAAGALSRCQFDFRIPTNLGVQNLFSSGAVDPNLKAARQSEFTVGVERDLGGGYLFRGRYTHKNVDRAIEDIGIPTAGGSEAYIIGNPGFGLADKTARDFGYPSVKAVRKYDAMELQFDKRFTRKYYFNANYTYSRLFGNYSGLASSLEKDANGVGRTSPNVSRLFDLPFQAFTANGQPVDGRLPTDRPHVFKAYGAYTQDWHGNNSTEFSAFTTATSGTPLTTTYSLYSLAPQILFGQGDLGRTEMYTQSDVAVRHKYRFGSNERFTMVAEIDVLNVFNESNELGRQTAISGTNVVGANIGFTTGTAAQREVATILGIFNGGIQTQVLNFLNAPTNPERRSGTYNLSNLYQGPREVRFGFRLLF